MIKIQQILVIIYLSFWLLTAVSIAQAAPTSPPTTAPRATTSAPSAGASGNISCPADQFITTFGCVPKANALPYLVSLIAGKALPFAVSFAIIMIIYAGITYITSSGEQEKIGQAKAIITTAIIGLILLLLIKTIAGNIIGIPEVK